MSAEDVPAGPDGLLDRVRVALGAHRHLLGWATVDLDLAQHDLGSSGGSAEPVRAEDAPDDALLGSRCRVIHPPGADPLVLLTPSTEGRLAASLARHGEGLAVHYLIAGPDAADRLAAGGLGMSSEADGPLGRQRLVLGGPRWGPHIVVAGLEPPPVPPRAATIGR